MSTVAQTLREEQALIKSAYKSDPSTAIVTLKSTGSLDATLKTCKLLSGPSAKEASRIAGELCSGDMLLDALVAYAGITLKAVATALGLSTVSGKVTAEGNMDFKGMLGVDKGTPVGITSNKLGFDLSFGSKEGGEEVTEDEVERLRKLTERHCVVLQTLVNKMELNVRVVWKGEKEEDGIEREIIWGMNA